MHIHRLQQFPTTMRFTVRCCKYKTAHFLSIFSLWGTLILALYMCYYNIKYRYDANVQRNYDENYDATVGGNRKYRIIPATINGYKLCKKHNEYAIVAKIERASGFAEMCVVDKLVCHSRSVLQESYAIKTPMNISFCETCHEKCKTIKQTSVDAKLAFEQLKIKNFGNRLLVVMLIMYFITRYLHEFDRDLVKRLQDAYEDEQRENEVEMRPMPIAESV